MTEAKKPAYEERGDRAPGGPIIFGLMFAGIVGFAILHYACGIRFRL